jgi:hypothetical protein
MGDLLLFSVFIIPLFEGFVKGGNPAEGATKTRSERLFG